MSAEFDRVTIWIHAFIPMETVNALGNCFAGDGRDFSSSYDEQRFRARSEITIDGFLAGTPESIEFHQCGESHRLDCATGEILESETAGTDGMSFHDFHVGNTFPDAEGGVIDNPNEQVVTVLYDGVTQNPLVLPSPDIDINLVVTVDPVNRTVAMRGAVNAFPDYESYAIVDGGEPVTLFQRRHNLDPAGGLPGGADQAINALVTV